MPAATLDTEVLALRAEEILPALEAAEFHELPETAMRAARLHREQIIPQLIEAIRSAVVCVRNAEKPANNAHFLSLFLLAELRAKEALPAILEAVTLPGEAPFDLFGDAITGSLPTILATLADDQPELLDGLVRDENVNEYVRSAALTTFTRLAARGAQTRESVVERLCGYLRDGRNTENVYLVSVTVCELCELAVPKSLPEIHASFDAGLVDEFLIQREDVEIEFNDPEATWQRTLKSAACTIDDAVAELSHWASFAKPKAPSPAPIVPLPINPKPKADVRRPADNSGLQPSFTRPAAPRAPDQRVGRNDPCPCGSGKKFKKCCGGNH